MKSIWIITSMAVGFAVSASATAADHRSLEVADFTQAAESTINGVVSIKSFATPTRYSQPQSQDFFNDPFFEFFFGPQNSPRRGQRQHHQGGEEAQRELGLGSGVIISSDGYIATNNHVIAGAERLEVTLNDNRVFNATVVGSDEATDLALIKIDAEDLPVIPMGNSDDLKVGEWVLAVGNPFGLTSTVTTGIVSAKARRISAPQAGKRMGIESFIQTDAAVNPGNSGGALVNLNGELVGINSAIYSQTGSYAGYSFAVPTSIVIKITDDLRQYGTAQRAVLGVTFTELTDKLAKENNITAVRSGLLVSEVADRGAAMEAGIEKGDVIVGINGVETLNSGQLLEQVNRYRPGDKVSIEYIRNNTRHTANATLYSPTGSTKIITATSVADLGCAFRKVSDENRRQLRISGGVQVSGIKDGPFKEAGIKDGFIIIDINGMRITSPEDVEKIHSEIVKSTDQDHVMFITGIYPTGKKMYYAVDLAD